MEKSPILLISARSDLGGGQKYLHDFCVATRGIFDYDIAAPNELPYGPKFNALADHFFELPHRSFGLVRFFKLVGFARHNQVKVVYSHGRGAGIYSRLMKLFGFKVIHSFHGIHLGHSLVARIKDLLDHLLHPLTDGFVFVSESEKKKAENNGFSMNRPFVILPPIAPHFSEKESKSKSSQLRLGCIARFDQAKGIDLLLKHLEAFHVAYPKIDWMLELAGGGDSSIFQIPQAIANRVKLRGPILNPIEFLKTLDLYLAASRTESLNISVLEAISQDVPCLISDISGHDYFIAKNAARKFTLEDFSSFNSALSQLVEDRNSGKATLSQELKQHLMHEHSPEEMRSRFSAFYSKIIG
jgi:glycosyltransferase involved in cell wall biosynthesis